MKGLVAMMLLFFASLSAKADTLEAYIFEYIPDFPDSIIEQRLKVIESQTNVPLPFNERVRAFVDYFSIKNRQYTRVMLRRKGIYFPVFEEKLKEYGLPDELKYLSIIESGLNPQAKSRVGAAGLWQFMPYTGKVYGLDQDWYVDERHDPEKSTVAACKFLKDLNGMFDNWLYAVAAYNCGPGNVRKAIRRSGYKKDFWDVYAYLPRETRGYVPQFIAMTYLMKYHEEHFIFVDSLEYVPDHDVLTVNQYLNLEVFANCSNTCLEDIRKLNPELRFNAVPEGRSYALRVPKHNHGFIMENLAMLMDTAKVKGKEAELAKAALRDGSTVGKDKVYYRVRSGDVLGTIAERYGVGVSELRRWNNIHGSMIRVGQTLTIYTNKAPAKATTTVSSKPQPLPDDKTYIVKPGDSLWIISRKYEGLSIEKLKEINNLKSNDLKPGQKLKLG